MNTYNVHNMFALFNIIFASHDKANNGVILEVQLFSFIRSLQYSITWCGVFSSSLQWQSGDSTLLMFHKNLFRLIWPFRRLSKYTSVALESRAWSLHSGLLN